MYAFLCCCNRMPRASVARDNESRWDGLGPPQNLKLVIESKNGVIVSGTHRVSPKLVGDLIRSLTANVLVALTPSNLGVTASWPRAKRGHSATRVSAGLGEIVIRKGQPRITKNPGLFKKC